MRVDGHKQHKQTWARLPIPFRFGTFELKKQDYDSERLLIASDDGIDGIDIKTDCTIERFHDNKTFQVDVMREEKLIVAISGKNHQVHLLPTIVIEGINAELCKMDDTKNCSLFCLGKLVLDTPPQASLQQPVRTSVLTGLSPFGLTTVARQRFRVLRLDHHLWLDHWSGMWSDHLLD